MLKVQSSWFIPKASGYFYYKKNVSGHFLLQKKYFGSFFIVKKNVSGHFLLQKKCFKSFFVAKKNVSGRFLLQKKMFRVIFCCKKNVSVRFLLQKIIHLKIPGRVWAGPGFSYFNPGPGRAGIKFIFSFPGRAGSELYSYYESGPGPGFKIWTFACLYPRPPS
jgi:hypothetical protein